MPQALEDQIRDALRNIALPQGGDAVALGMLAGLEIRDGCVSAAVEVSPDDAARMEPARKAMETAIRAIPGVASASVVLTAHRSGPPPRSHPGPGREKIALPGVKKIVAVGSGKGGVGKSTTAANLAVSLARRGLKAGLLDADIYGPSIPRMFGLKGKPQVRDDKKLVPMERYGVGVMSMGFLIAEDAPMIWRGPMVHGAITQLFRDVAWGERDVLIVDLPPGTGDAQLTMAQSVPLAGAIIVSTPQDIALIDARKALAMFVRVGVPVLGIVENMSFFLCPHCGERSDIFSHGGARAEAEKLGLPFLGEVPLDIAIRQTSDEGAPVAEALPEGAQAEIYKGIAETVARSLGL